jgi:multidrug resistance efflux pump
MGYDEIIRGHVGSIARGIDVANAQPNRQGLATVNPIFTWVRLAQRIPVRIHIDAVPEGVVLSAGMTATVQIDTPPRGPGAGAARTAPPRLDPAPQNPPANARSSPASRASRPKE